jgi:hypothetical protein
MVWNYLAILDCIQSSSFIAGFRFNASEVGALGDVLVWCCSLFIIYGDVGRIGTICSESEIVKDSETEESEMNREKRCRRRWLTILENLRVVLKLCSAKYW